MEKLKKPKMPKIKKERKPKVKKPKVKKPKVKKPKKVKEKKLKKEKKPMTKKKLVLVILLFLVLAGSAAAGYYFMFNKQAPVEEERREPPRYDYFSLDDDQIDSITKTVGYRAIADAYGKDIVFEPWYEDAEEAKKAAKKAEKEKAEAEKAAAESSVETVEETTTTYVYKDIETAPEDVKKYVTHLIDNLGFKEVYPFYIDNPAGYITLSKDSSTKGYTIQIDIDYTKDNYTIILEKIKKPKSGKEGTAKPTISRETALDIIKKTPTEVLGLNESLDNLTLMGDPGHSTVDGMDCYGIHVYKTVNGNRSTVILGTYYVASDRETIYKYDVMTDTYTKLS
ncbi:MAG: hypothetical protein VB018_00170 [Lachnospiraceae bacterium]|nr:hypothetical protein [Lachnospiraceae bacterium]